MNSLQLLGKSSRLFVKMNKFNALCHSSSCTKFNLIRTFESYIIIISEFNNRNNGYRKSEIDCKNSWTMKENNNCNQNKLNFESYVTLLSRMNMTATHKSSLNALNV